MKRPCAILVQILVLVGLCFVSCNRPEVNDPLRLTPVPPQILTQAATPEPATTSTPSPTWTPSLASVLIVEEYTIYKTVIESTYLGEDIESIVIKDHTGADLPSDGSLDDDMKFVQENLGAAVDLETLNDYKSKNGQPWELDESSFPDMQYVVLLSEVELNEVFEQGDGWNQFYMTYPNSQGVMTLSRVGFNTQVDQALVYVGNQADYLAGRGYYVFLTKKGGAWTVQSEVLVWIS